MHPYYSDRKHKFKKMMNQFLSQISSELEAATGQSYPQLLEEIFSCYEQDFLEYFPYIGGDKNSGTQNLTGAFMFVAMGQVCRHSYGMTLEQWGFLTTECYRRYFDRIPGFLLHAAGKLMGKPRLINFLLRKKDEKNASNAAKNPGSFVTQVQSPTEEYPAIFHTRVCPLCNFARTQGYMEYMPYLCNLDYVMFAAIKVPFYREKTCAAGDDCCDFKMKAGAPVSSFWPCHSLTPEDPLK